MSDKELLAEQLEFNITAKNKKLKLTYKQIVVLLESLWDFKESIKTVGTDTEEFLRKRILQNKEDDPGMETMNWLDKK